MTFDVLSIRGNTVTIIADQRSRENALAIADHGRLSVANDRCWYAIEPHGCFKSGDTWEVDL